VDEMTIPRSDFRTAYIVNLVCKLCDETGMALTAMNILEKYVSEPVMLRVLLHRNNRRMLY
jgi:hypothetical protein